MSDIGAAAPPATVAAPPPEAEVVSPPEPLKVEPLPAEKPKPSIRDSLAKSKEAIEKAEKVVDPKAAEAKALADKEKPATVDKAKAAKPAEKAEVVDPKAEPVKAPPKDRDETGKFQGAPKEDDKTAAPAGDRSAPKRFTPEARAMWDALDDETHGHFKDETHRAFRELEAGIEKHRESSKRFNDVYKPYDDMAKAAGIDSKATLDGYVAIDKALHSNDPKQIMGAIDQILSVVGLDRKQFAQAVMGGQQQRQQPNGQQPAPQQDIGKLVEERVNKVVAPILQHLQGQQVQQHEQTLADWAKDKPHFPMVRERVVEIVRDDGLSPDDAYVKAVTEAQDAARAFLGEDGGKRPDPKPAKPSAEEDPDEQIAKGSKQISGAPGEGSAPSPRKPGSPMPDVRESIRKAMLKAR
jgi:hypothetical protein